MEPMEKLWQDVDALKEGQIRHDERIRQNEQQASRALKEVVRLEGDLNAKFDALTVEIREGFKIVGERIDEIEGRKKRDEGYRAGQLDALKKFGLWFTILTFAVGVIMWRLNQ
ncbi:hypothetical protein PR08_gp10 [Idiomarinaceae phage Phi1M2-2]|uniref:hypothetical protein n=1 Tax=Idiomarinaceae phage Phi1M2-2 TaxID=1527515 RepID=UPI0004F7B8B9|nr:hypothetical protein PR08_gp10 [Idiomarinaceae phage Phi1M2-2]AIM40768.1 hypothetical protein M22_010 [Idiomarinaceae phage Phi1M2-2]